MIDRNIKQTRTFDSVIRIRESADQPIIEGKFISFTGEFRMPWGDYETISPDLEIEGDDVRALINHDTTLVIGRTLANTLTLERRSDGEWGTILVNPKDTDAMNCHARVERGDVSQCSFGFDILDEETEFLEDGTIHWTIKKIRLYEVSVCTFPAYEDTGVKAREANANELRQKRVEAVRESLMAKLKGVK